MKHLLISTIGNRDIQFDKKDIENLPPEIQTHLSFNSETPTMVISKQSNGVNFFFRSKEIYENYAVIEPYLEYPLIQNAIQNEGVPDKIILLATDQEPNFHLDTIYIAKILTRKLSNNLNVTSEIRAISNAIDTQAIFSNFQSIIDEHKDDYHITIHTSGGLPNFRICAFMASLFKENVKVVNYIGKEARDASMYHDYERHALNQIVENMLRNWNYSALLLLPGISDDVKKITRFAIARLALDLEKAREFNLSTKLEYPIPKEDDQVALEKELMFSAYIKYHQKEFGDFLFRIFTFHDNMLVPHVQEILGGEFEYDKTGHQKWIDLLSHPDNIDIKEYLENAKFGNASLKFDFPNKEAYYKIIHFCKKDSNCRKMDQNKYSVLNLFNKLRSLADLRNKIAHGYKGVNESMILSAANVSSIKDITKMVDKYLEIEFQKLEPYREINEKILELI